MSCNIDNWKTKKLDDFTVPIASFYKHPRQDWHPMRVAKGPNPFSARLECSESFIGGLLDGDDFQVTEIDISGEGSGTFFSWILEPALRESKGALEAVLIWERGDSIERLKVKDGKVTREDIDL